MGINPQGRIAIATAYWMTVSLRDGSFSTLLIEHGGQLRCIQRYPEMVAWYQ